MNVASALRIVAVVAAGAFTWTFAEYLLHRFAMHQLHGRGIMSREHLEHHVAAGWRFSKTMLLSWLGVLVVSVGLWFPVGWWIGGPAVGAALAAGWVIGYFFYEYQHAASHLHGPRGRYTRMVRRHHFHHHFGHPMANHGVTMGLWDRVFGTYESPEQVRVPRRLALPWLLGPDGELRPEYTTDYVLVGSVDSRERLAALDRIRAFASQAPED